MYKAYIALGSNLYDPATQVTNAFAALDKIPRTKVVKRSSLYQSTPVDYDNQPDFINAVAQVQTEANPEALLKALLDIEHDFGRERPFANAPRILDLDLLQYEDVECKTDFLTLPHPRMHLRSFVLLPLAEIAPDLTIRYVDVTANACNVVELAQAFQHQGIAKLSKHSV